MAGRSSALAHYNVHQMDTARHRVTSQDSRWLEKMKVASNSDRSDQQLHRDEIKVVEACGAEHLVFQQTEAGVAASAFRGESPPSLEGLKAVEVVLALNPQEVAYLPKLSKGGFFRGGVESTRNPCLHGPHTSCRTPPCAKLLKV